MKSRTKVLFGVIFISLCIFFGIKICNSDNSGTNSFTVAIIRVNSTPFEYKNTSLIKKDSPKNYIKYKYLLRETSTREYNATAYSKKYPEDAVIASPDNSDGTCVLDIFSNADSLELVCRYNQYK